MRNKRKKIKNSMLINLNFPLNNLNHNIYLSKRLSYAFSPELKDVGNV